MTDDVTVRIPQLLHDAMHLLEDAADAAFEAPHLEHAFQLQRVVSAALYVTERAHNDAHTLLLEEEKS